MIASSTWAGKRYAVLGLARSGAATVRALVAAGADVVAWDANKSARDLLVASFPGEGRGPDGAVEVWEGGGASQSGLPQLDPGLRRGTVTVADPETIDLTGFDALIVSPGVPLNRHPVAAKARAAGVPIVGDIELFARGRASLPPHKVVGVTGTNGKSTTVSLIHHILQTARIPSRLGGNIGLPILAQEPLPQGGVYVLELSSYQLDLTQTLDCDVAVLLNITPDHLDRYDGFEDYAESKARLFQMQSAGHLAVIAVDDETTRRISLAVRDEGRIGVIEVCGDGFNGLESGPALRGPHNSQNVACARMVAAHLDISEAALSEALATYPGLPHRMERVRERGGVAYVNDSKATNCDSTAPALAAFKRVHWILGGQAKSDDLDACRPHFGHVARAYTIGEAGPRFATILHPDMRVEESGTLAAAVTSAAANARAGDTVLLSPACASFDQFRDFEDRGDQFRQLVEALPEGVGA